MKQIWLSRTFELLWKGQDPFDQVEQLEGEVFRQVGARRTVRFAANGSHYFAKIHYGIGWREIIKNLIYLKLPVIGATNEWRALDRLRRISVRTMTPVAFGQMGRNPARIRSFLITEEIKGTTGLEQLCSKWKLQRPTFSLRKALTLQIATIIQRMHNHGINHRDCYLCHFYLDTSCGYDQLDPNNLHLYIIDLHRAQLRRRTPKRWIIKDLAGLYFSAMDIGLTRTDKLRFIKTYEQMPLRIVFQNRKKFWRRVKKTALALYKKHK